MNKNLAFIIFRNGLSFEQFNKMMQINYNSLQQVISPIGLAVLQYVVGRFFINTLLNYTCGNIKMIAKHSLQHVLQNKETKVSCSPNLT